MGERERVEEKRERGCPSDLWTSIVTTQHWSRYAQGGERDVGGERERG